METHASIRQVHTVLLPFPLDDDRGGGSLGAMMNRLKQWVMAARRFICGLIGAALFSGGGQGMLAQKRPRSFELLTHRMDVDVDGAPNAYGPVGTHTLDALKHARYRGEAHGEIVGFLTEDDHPNIPVRQGRGDPYPGLYISQTAFTDPARTNEKDIRRYVDAARINYIVLGTEAHRRGARLGDFVAVYSRATHRSVYGIVGDDGNPSGNEGSLHLLQALGYPFHDGRHYAVEVAEIVVRFFPASNPHHRFFRSQEALDEAAKQSGLSRDFRQSPLAHPGHPKH